MLRRVAGNVRYIVAILSDKRKRFFFYIGLYAVSAILSSLLMPALFRYIFDIVGYSDTSKMLYVSIGAMSVFVVTILIDFYVSVYGNARSANIINHLAADLYTQMHRLPYDRREREFQEADILQRIQSGTDATLALSVTLLKLALSVALMLTFVIYAFGQAAVYSVIALLIVGVSMLRAYFEGRRIAKLSAEYEKTQAEKERICYDIMKRTETVMVNRLCEYAIAENNRVNSEIWRIKRRQTCVQVFFSSAAGTVSELFKGFSMLIFYPLKAAGLLSLGQIAANNNVLTQVQQQSVGFNGAYASLQNYVEPIDRNRELFRDAKQGANYGAGGQASQPSDHVSSHPDQVSQSCGRVSSPSGFSVSLKDVVLYVPSSNRPILSIDSLTIRQGEKIAILGKNGGGKSTFLRLIMGYVRPSGGTVSVSGENPYELPYELRGRIFAYAPAKQLLFQTSGVENIDMAAGTGGRGHDARTDDLILTTFHIERELLNKSAAELSEGQKQRINILRMLAAQAEVSVLDEPTSSVDSDCADDVMRYLYTHTRTLIYTTHRAEDIIYADRILLFENGEITLDCAPDDSRLAAALSI